MTQLIFVIAFIFARESKLEKVNVVTLHEFSSLSRTACYYAGALNDSGITVRNARDTVGSSQGQQTIQGACVSETAVHDHGRRLNQREFRPMAEVPFRPVRLRPSAQRIQRKRGLW